MSSELGMDFGEKSKQKYKGIIDRWSDNPGSEERWGATLQEALADPLIETLLSKESMDMWTKEELSLPSEETFQRYAKIAAKFALVVSTNDLFRRLNRSIEQDEKFPDKVEAALRLYTPSEIAARAQQTLAQVFDMARGWFNRITARRLEETDQLTGKKKWVTVGGDSRHAGLDGQVRDLDGTFTYNKKQIYGPRPADGNPNDWSNCSCYLIYQQENGKWLGRERE